VTDTNASSRSAQVVALSVLTDVRAAALTRRGLIVLAAVLAGVGLTFNWSWLVASGAAPLILSVLPCVAMCGLGLCMAGHNHTSAGGATRSDGALSDATAEAERSCCSQPTARSK
jgi:hypothetical protein